MILVHHANHTSMSKQHILYINHMILVHHANHTNTSKQHILYINHMILVHHANHTNTSKQHILFCHSIHHLTWKQSNMCTLVGPSYDYITPTTLWVVNALTTHTPWRQVVRFESLMLVF